MTHHGYPLEWFVEPIDEYLKCGICGKVLENPRATSCGHVFCQCCIHSWIDYYGICPNRCGELELHHLTRALHIEKLISVLQTHCKYYRSGCAVQIALADKHGHEKTCPYRTCGALNPEIRRTTSALEETDHSWRFKRSRSNTVTTRVSAVSNKFAPPVVRSSSRKMQTQHIYRVKRTRPREPLGLVLVSGPKNADGKPLNFYVKEVKPDTPAWRGGLQDGDIIVQVDGHDLCRITQKEAVSRIKDKIVLTLTILRGGSPRDQSPPNLTTEEHIYDEILYADLSQPLSQQDENFPLLPLFHMDTYSPSVPRKNRFPMHEDIQNRHRMHTRPMSPAANYVYRATSSAPSAGQKGSKDSGLSSGSSGSPPPFARQPAKHHHKGMRHYPGSTQNLDQEVMGRHSYRTEREMLKSYLKTQKKSQPTNQPTSSKGRNCRIEGEYEVEEIYLEKNGTSQLGITLGYDTKTSAGHLYICEILPTGLAAKDGRLMPGDIIRRVNGFEVYDPEEAILLFLEQDQDITLTAARKIIKTPPSQPGSAHHPQLTLTERNLGMLESTLMCTTKKNLRRIDSCGSLDSHSHKYGTDGGVSDYRDFHVDEPVHLSQGNLLQGESDGDYVHMRTRRSSSPTPKRRSPPYEFLSQQLSGTHHTSPVNSFKPLSLNERPKTIGEQRPVSPMKLVRPYSTTPDQSRRIYGLGARKQSLGDIEARLKSPSPSLPSPSPSRSVLQTFRHLASEIEQLPIRCDKMADFGGTAVARSESLV